MKLNNILIYGILLLISLLAFNSLVIAAEPFVLVSDIRANEYENSLVYNAAKEPRIAVNEAGDLIICWINKDHINDTPDVLFNRFSKNGTKLDDQKIVEDEFHNETPEVLYHSNGEFMIMWAHLIGKYWIIKAQKYSADGNSIGNQSNMSTDISGGDVFREPEFSIINQNELIFSWYGGGWANGDNGVCEIYARRYNWTGDALTASSTINSITTGEQKYCSVVAKSNGNSVICWHDSRNTSNYEIYAQVLNSDGTRKGADFKVNSNNLGIHLGNVFESSIAIDGNDNYAIAWAEKSNDLCDIYVQWYTSDDQPIGGNTRVNDIVGIATETDVAIAADESGNWMVCWQEERNGTYDVYAQYFRAPLQPEGANFRVDQVANSTTATAPDVVLKNGCAYFAWSSTQVNNFTDVYFNIMKLPGTILVSEPQPGVECSVGAAQEIRWQADNVGVTVNVDLSIDNGLSWKRILTETENDGAEFWKPSIEDISDQCVIKVSNIKNQTIFATSSGTFKILTDLGKLTSIAPQIPSGWPAPELDGKIDEPIWNVAAPESLLQGGVPDAWGITWDALDDNLVIWRALWSAETNQLYVAVQVNDDVKGTFDDNDPAVDDYNSWNDDSIEFFTDGDHSGGDYDDNFIDAQQWRVSGENIRNLRNYEANGSQAYEGTDFVPAVRYLADDVWTCEAVFTIYDELPAIEKILTVGQTIGWNVWYNDSDDELLDGTYQRDHQVGWLYSGPAFKQADYFGELKLQSAVLPTAWHYQGNTGKNATIIISPQIEPQVEGAPIQPGDYIGAFTSSGVCAGWVRWIDQNISLTIDGDNDLTSEIEGFTANELINYRIYRPATLQEWIVNQVAYNSGTGLFNHNAFMILSTLNVDVTETISTPTVPTGVASAKAGMTLTFTTSGAISNQGHAVEYQFDWGNETQSEWGDAQQSISYSTAGTFSVKARACCQEHPDVVSEWSDAVSVVISYCQLTTTVLPEGTGSIAILPDQTDFLYQDKVTLTAMPNVGYEIDAWSGDLSGSESSYELVMDDDKSVTVQFKKIKRTPVHFSFSMTGENYPVAIQAVAGMIPEVGDEIAVFTPGGLCVGASVWTGLLPLSISAWKDDPQTDAVDGYLDNEPMQFRVWDAGANDAGVELLATPEYQLGDGTFGYQTYSIVSTLTIVPLVQQKIVFQPGWSWVSMPIQPEFPHVESVFQQTAHLDILIDGSGNFYVPGLVNSIGDWNVKNGYKIHLSAKDSILVTGQRIPATTPIELNEHWNFIAYLPDHPMATEAAVSPIVDKMEILKNDHGQFYIPGLLNTMEEMQPMEGYKLYMSEATSFTYPIHMTLAKHTQTVISQPSAAEHFSYHDQTGDNYVVIVDNVTLNNARLEPNDEIGVFTTDGVCVGAARWEGTPHQAIVAWADDQQTEAIDGYLNSDVVQFRIWDASDDCEFIASAIYSKGDGRFGNTGYAHISEISALTTDIVGVQGQLPTEFALRQNYPNPFNPETHILFELPAAERATLTIYNMHGQLVETLVNGRLNAGSYSITWQALNQPSGIYLCYFTAGNYQKSIKLLLVK
ncbi:T9SS type A sorting domain-containing protein [candidate division KSB1 bacterium]|nr:T9SS type A sorting domain-containing protein [candidate division KSB1 bacterium]